MANQETSRGGMDEFIVDKEKVDIVHTFKEKTERLFEVKILFDSVDKQKQWIAVHGEKIDRKNAKEYIIALCHPDAVQQFYIGSYDTEVLNEDAIEQIEKQTNAAICPLDQEKVQIRGTDLAVILAVSSLESIIGQHGADTETDGDKTVTNEKNQASEESITSLSRLDTTLRKTLSSQSDVTCSIDDYNQTSPSIKMTVIKCMSEFTDIDDSDLFPSTGSSCGPLSYKLPVYIDDDDEDDNDNDKRDAGNILEHQDFMDGQKSCHVGSITKQMTQAVISPFSSPQPQKSVIPDTPEHQYLRKFGLSVGYSAEEVEEGLLYVDNKTKPADFLEMLNEIKQKISDDSSKISTEDNNAKSSLNKITESKKEADTAKNIDQDNNSKGSFPPPPEIPTGEGAGIAGRRSLPQDYKKRLIKDFTEENGDLSVTELKRRNEERQKMLRMAFDNNQSEKEKAENTQSEGKSNKKKKRKKKKKNKTQEKEIGKTEKKPTETSGQNVKNNVSMHVISTDDDDEDGNVDEEETFVLKLWKKNESKQKNDSDDECKITHVTQAVPILVQPQANSSNQQSPRHYQPRQQLPRHSGPPPPLMDIQRYPSPQYRGRPLFIQPQPYVNRPPNHLQPFRQPQPSMNRPTNYLQPAPIRNAQGRQQPNQLRYIVIDGSNVAMCHGNGKVFSCKGIQIVVDYFLKRGHKQVTAFVPEWRKYNPRPENPIRDQNILEKLKSEGHLVFTPSRRLNGRLIVSYDDRFVLELAEREDGIVVSNDQYRDLMGEKFSWKKVIEERLLLFSFAGDNFMPPFDPLGRDGPTLDDFLCKPTSRKRPASPPSSQVNVWQQRDSGPAIKHPGYINRGHPSNPNFHGTPRFQQNLPQGNQGYKQQNTGNHDGFQNRGKGRGGYNNNQNSPRKQHSSVRSEEKTQEMEKSLLAIFPDHLGKIQEILNNHQSETDLQKLTNYLMNAIFSS